MSLFRRMIGGKEPQTPEHPHAPEDAYDALARPSAHASAAPDERAGLVAISDDLDATMGRGRHRKLTDFDIDDYVPELDDYEPGVEGPYLRAEAAEPARHVPRHHHTAPPAYQPAGPGLTRPDRAPLVAAQEPPRGASPLVRPVSEPLPDDGADAMLVHVPGPAAGRSGPRRAGRVKTRLLGFDSAAGLGTDPFESGQQAAASPVARFPVGWIVVVGGPGRGASFTLFNGVSAIGRGEDQPVKLDFGDTSISRTNHAMVAYDNEQRKFFFGHGGKANIVRLNGKPVLSTEELNHDDRIRIGETTLRFIALCGSAFDWTEDGEDGETESADAAIL